MHSYRPLYISIAAVSMFLLHLLPASSYEIVENEDTFRSDDCPAVLMFETAAYLSDMTIELPCRCKPEKTRSVVWYYQEKTGAKKIQVLTDSKGSAEPDNQKIQSSLNTAVKFRILEFNLIVHKAQTEDSGIYLCGTKDDDFFYGYSVDIQDSKDAYVAFEDRQGPPQPDLVTKYFRAYTIFWPWTVCDRCGVTGEQRRIGLCYVSSTYLDSRFHGMVRDESPCGSSAVPPQFKKPLSTRRTEVHLRSCSTECHGGKKGILSTLTDTIWALKDYIPWVPKVPTEVHTHQVGSTMSMACPGAEPEHAVAWDKDDEPLYRSEYLTSTNKSTRIYIDHGDHLNIRSVRLSDAGTYYCWLQGKRKAGFRLAVKRDPLERRKFSDPESIFAMKIIGMFIVLFLIIFLLIHCVKCCCRTMKCLPDDEV